jgi:hypothetical protein
MRGRYWAGVAVVCTLTVLGCVPAALAQRAGSEPNAKPLFGLKAEKFGKTTLEDGHFAYSIPRGTSVDDAAVLISYSDKPLTLRLYAADMVQAKGGALAPKQRDGEMTTVGAWLKLKDPEQAVVGLPSEGRVSVPFTLTVPEHVAPGDYPGAFVVAADVGNSDRGLGVQARVALLVRLTVPGKVNLEAAVSRPRADADPGGYAFDVDVHNEGNVLFTMTGEVELHRGGKKIASVPLAPRDIYVIPDGKTTLSGTWEDPPLFGRVNAVARIRTFINQKPTKTFTSASITLTVVPWRMVGFVLSALAILGGGLFLSRNRLRAWRGRRREDKEILRKHRTTGDLAPAAPVMTNGAADPATVRTAHSASEILDRWPMTINDE